MKKGSVEKVGVSPRVDAVPVPAERVVARIRSLLCMLCRLRLDRKPGARPDRLFRHEPGLLAALLGRRLGLGPVLVFSEA